MKALRIRIASPSDRGVHFLVYKANQELHTLRWLNPEVFGPFDHKWKVPGDKDTMLKAPIFSVQMKMATW